MSLVETLGAKFRGISTYVEPTPLWFEDFAVEEVCLTESQEPIEIIPVAPPVDSKRLFLTSAKLPHSDNLQVNFTRLVRFISTYMVALHEVAHFGLAQRRSNPRGAINRVKDHPAASEVQERVLETFVGYVDHVAGDTAYVRLKSREHGDVLYGQYPASKLASKGIGGQTRFLCETVKVGETTRLDLKALPDVEVSEDEIRAIDEEIDRAIPWSDPSIEY